MPTVLARRILAVSPDEAFGQLLAAGLAQAGTVDVHQTLDAIGAPGASDPPALYVIHLAGKLAGAASELVPRLAGAGPVIPVIAVIPRADLAAVVELLQSSDRIAGVMVADRCAPHRLAALATRVLAGDLVGLDSVLAPETPIHTQLVGDYHDKARCLARVSEFVEHAQVPRRYRAPIEQCLDEMVMNALYDAPVDAHGARLFAGIPTRTRITMRTEHSVTVRYACDGKQLAVSVRDAFGTLERSTVLSYLHKCLHAEQPVDRKAGGAGLGLYLMVTAATAVSFHVSPGLATEALCRFDLEAPEAQLEELELVQLAAAGHRAAAARRLPAGSRARSRALVATALIVLLGLFAGWALHRPTVAPAAAVATVELDSQPTGAAVEIDGVAVGSTPLTLSSLVPGQPVSIVFRRTGYRSATARLEVPGAGTATRLVQPLEASDAFVRVRFVSSPPGAEIRDAARPRSIDRTYTPADVFVEADRIQRFTLTMPRHVPLVIAPFTPGRGAQGLEKGGALVEGATLRIEATVAGTVTVSGAPHCTEVALPVDCTLAPGTYAVVYLGPDRARFTRTVAMAAEDVVERFELGVIEAGPGKRLQPGGARKVVVEAGTHTVTVSDDAGDDAGTSGATHLATHPATVTVRPGATVLAN
jgi:hypothetical protein